MDTFLFTPTKKSLTTSITIFVILVNASVSESMWTATFPCYTIYRFPLAIGSQNFPEMFLHSGRNEYLDQCQPLNSWTFAVLVQ